MQPLRENPSLRQLLAPYTTAEDREAWQDRRMTLDGLEEAGLVRLHGTLIACGWIEQNTGAATMPRPGVVGQCYRATPAGQRALRELAQAGEDDRQAA